MWTAIECAGHPRDMGLAQGGALAPVIRAELARSGLSRRRPRGPRLRPLTSGPLRGRGAGRELIRHFAHLAERMEGLAQRADVPLDAILELHLRVRAGGGEGGLLARRTTLRAGRGSEGPNDATHRLLERTLPRAATDPDGGEAGWVVRESRPAVGFRSVEITLPWLVTSVAGVNEGGLAVIAGPVLWGTGGTGGWAPASLLVQECLQRFEDLGAALDWCRKRPVEGEQSFVVSDASGRAASVHAAGRERRVQLAEGELFLEGGELAAGAAGGGTSLDPGVDRVWLDPRRRSLRLEAAGLVLERSLGSGAPSDPSDPSGPSDGPSDEDRPAER